MRRPTGRCICKERGRLVHSTGGDVMSSNLFGFSLYSYTYIFLLLYSVYMCGWEWETWRDGERKRERGGGGHRIIHPFFFVYVHLFWLFWLRQTDEQRPTGNIPNIYFAIVGFLFFLFGSFNALVLCMRVYVCVCVCVFIIYIYFALVHGGGGIPLFI